MKNGNFKNYLFVMVGSAFAMLIALNIVRAIEKKINTPTENEIKNELRAGMVKGAKSMNSKAPFMVDDDTRLDLVTVSGELTSNYFYTFPNYSSLEIDTNSATPHLKKMILSTICDDEGIKESLSYGGILNYTYSGNDNIEIVHIKIKKSDCDQE
jgi:hypothetical protein